MENKFTAPCLINIAENVSSLHYMQRGLPVNTLMGNYNIVHFSINHDHNIDTFVRRCALKSQSVNQ